MPQSFLPLCLYCFATLCFIDVLRETKKSKGIAYVLYVVPEDALHAYRELDGTIFQVSIYI